MGTCTSKTKTIIQEITKSQELHDLVKRLYYEHIDKTHPKKKNEKQLKNIQKHFENSKYLEKIIYPN